MIILFGSTKLVLISFILLMIIFLIIRNGFITIHIVAIVFYCTTINSKLDFLVKNFIFCIGKI